MTMPLMLRGAAALLFAAAGLLLAPQASAAEAVSWITTWSAAPDQAGPALRPQTIRQIMRVSAGGQQVRVRLSNLFGIAPLTIGAAHVALPAEGSAIQTGTDRALSFAGKPGVTIAPGESALSDALPMAVAPLQSLAVSLYLPQGSEAPTLHGIGTQTVHFSDGVDATSASTLPRHELDDSRYFVTDIEALAPGQSAGTLVALGDSVTDGVGSTPDQSRRWTDALAERLQGVPATAGIGVANAGIAGNRILRDGIDPYIGPSALSRLEGDVMSKPGVRWVILLEGINDITAASVLPLPEDQPSAQRIIEGMKAIAERAHAGGVKIVGATLLPRAGATGVRAQTPQAEAKRLAVNEWIRNGRAFDAVLDFDRVLQDPDQPDRLRPDFDSGDHGHPNDAGYRAMAAAFKLEWLTP
ncbi:SGNH/GDSL hydrolase family protein [Ideonella sp. DXS29W]|uniref:SGNH/GDSL hydrolase family protein n=1 Tax=Ideonella lacteola TaxID=2984193 RepID=A0ABU9BX20_9BURK